jgi:hypothetical protein
LIFYPFLHSVLPVIPQPYPEFLLDRNGLKVLGLVVFHNRRPTVGRADSERGGDNNHCDSQQPRAHAFLLKSGISKRRFPRRAYTAFVKNLLRRDRKFLELEDAAVGAGKISGKIHSDF